MILTLLSVLMWLCAVLNPAVNTSTAHFLAEMVSNRKFPKKDVWLVVIIATFFTVFRRVVTEYERSALQSTGYQKILCGFTVAAFMTIYIEEICHVIDHLYHSKWCDWHPNIAIIYCTFTVPAIFTFYYFYYYYLVHRSTPYHFISIISIISVIAHLFVQYLF